MARFNIFQIYYDEPSRQLLDPAYLPLDNTKNERPDWYELWVIRNFLRNNQLSEDAWYGFLSPNFAKKTGLNAQHIAEFLEFSRDRSEVALILAYAWDQVAYFLNPFEQGEVWHPGIMALSQSVFRHLGYDVDLSLLATYSGNFTYCNYIVAKPVYWRKWLTLAEGFFDLAENQHTQLAIRLRETTSYGSIARQEPIKAFIQERLPALVLWNDRFRTTTLNTSSSFPVWDHLFEVGLATRGVLQACDELKKRYCETRELRFLELFKEVRRLVARKFALPEDLGNVNVSTFP
jgi:hypothetical protein